MIHNCVPAATTQSSVIQAVIFKAIIKLWDRKINKTRTTPKEPRSQNFNKQDFVDKIISEVLHHLPSNLKSATYTTGLR